jgi:DNA-binding NarL/FixJ family response regulator
MLYISELTVKGHVKSILEKLVHQVRGWYSGVAIKMGRRQGATREHI